MAFNLSQWGAGASRSEPEARRADLREYTEIRANWQVDDIQAVDNNYTWHQGRHTVTKPLASWANELLPIDVDIDASKKVVSLGLQQGIVKLLKAF